MARHVFSLDGPVVSMAAKDDILFITFHSGPGYKDTQCLSYLLYDVEKRKLLKKDRLPVSPVCS